MDSISKTITVLTTPVVNFTANPTEIIFPSDTTNGDPLAPVTIGLQDQTYPQSDLFDYSWSFGDGSDSTDQNLTGHNYDNWGNYSISLRVGAEKCADSLVRYVKILAPRPFAKFDSLPDACAPNTISFSNNSRHIYDYPITDTYLWDFGDGNVDNSKTPTHTYTIADTYPISLTVSSRSGTHTSYDTIVVYPEAVALFVLEKDFGYVDEELYFYNKSEEGDKYLWDFGDGTISNERDPKHIYLYETKEDDAPYTVRLEVWTENDCYDIYEMPESLFIDLLGAVTFPNAFTPELGLKSTNFDNSRFYPEVKGVSDFEFQIFNRWGELIYSADYEDGMDSKDVAWDGFYKNQVAAQGVYVWKVTGTYKDGIKFVKAGDVTLLR